jgi:hydrogenase large subunit
MAVAHYLEALDFQKEIVKIQTVFGGKNPHPNWLVGGVPSPINVHDTGSTGAINMERLNKVRGIVDQTIQFIDQVYLPDIMAIARHYPEWARIGQGLAGRNVLAYGDVPKRAGAGADPDALEMPRGAIVDGKLSEVHGVSLEDLDEIQEWITHSWYRDPADEAAPRHPYEGATEPHFELGPNAKGSHTAIEELDESAKYSFLKAPRWRGHAMEVGPLARYLVGYAQGAPAFKEPVDALLGRLDLPVAALYSTLGRTAARALEASWAAHKLKTYVDGLIANIQAGDQSTANTDKWRPETWPEKAQGSGYVEAPRGALGHWVVVKDAKIANYQCVVPTTWNASPRDGEGQIGPYEASLLGTPLADPAQPLEVLRTIHSFDPCLACSTHLMRPDGQQLADVKVA